MDRGHRARIIIYSAFTLLCMVAIFVFSAQNADSSQELSDGLLARLKELIALLPSISGQDAEHDIRKYAHLFEFCMLGVASALLFGELRRDFRLAALKSRFGALIAAWVFCIFYAATDELHQYFVPGRSAQVSDVALDSCGALIGCMIVFIIRLAIARAKGRGKNE